MEQDFANYYLILELVMLLVDMGKSDEQRQAQIAESAKKAVQLKKEAL